MQGEPANEDELKAGAALFARSWQFVMSVPRLDVLPPADRLEFAFAGRSNVGKSSLINALVNQHGLARTSNTPGRTQELIYFNTEGVDAYLVDMPGYGYAKAPKGVVENWTELVRDYLRGRTTLRRVYLLIDSRHGIKPVDREVMALLNTAAVSYQVVLTKIDKISLAKRAIVLDETRTAIASEGAAFPVVIATSSDNGEGVAELRAAIASLLSE
jgi:GTP-binding protein